MTSSLVRELVDSGVHFGHSVSRWNPKMAPYIFGKRSTIHVINVKETLRGILRAKAFLSQLVAYGKDVIFVGTKRQAKDAVREAAQACEMHYVSERWLGGTLTNFKTIRSRLARLEELEAMEEDGSLSRYSKKMISTLMREKRKILRNLDGIRKMEKSPGAMILIDVRREHIAVKEAKKLGIPSIAMIDTDSDPEQISLPIPGNDDSMRSIKLILSEIVAAINEGKAQRAAAQELESKQKWTRRRSRRPTTASRAEEEAPQAESPGPEEKPEKTETEPVATQ